MAYIKTPLRKWEVDEMPVEELRLLLQGLIDHLELTPYRGLDSDGNTLDFTFRKEWGGW